MNTETRKSSLLLNYLFNKIHVPIFLLAFISLFNFACNLDFLKNKEDNQDLELLSLLFLSMQPKRNLTFSPAPGFYNTPQSISIEYGEPGTRIFYTVDGSDPTESSIIYKEPIHIWRIAGADIRAIAYPPSGMPSPILDARYSYSELQTGQTVSYSTNDDGFFKNGVARDYILPRNLPEFVNNFVTVDRATGIIWKSCTQTQSDNGCGGLANTMDWNNANDGPNGCNTLNSANNGRGYYGLKTWRLPTHAEIKTIVDFGVSTLVKVNASAFPNTQSNALGYWTSTPKDANLIWYHSFVTPADGYSAKTDLRLARCVASPMPMRKFNPNDLGNGIIHDRKTNLLWQKCFRLKDEITCDGMAGQDVLWQPNLDYCDSLTLGNRKWRVPNINELNSIVLPESTAGFSTSTFPNSITEATATSTTLPSDTASYASITFDDVSLVNFDKAAGLAFVRCVTDF